MSTPSDIFAITLPRPLGVVFEYDRDLQQVVVVDLIPGSHAAQRQRVSRLGGVASDAAVQPGDVLRAVTATNIV
jgi:hypothetical protein